MNTLNSDKNYDIINTNKQKIRNQTYLNGAINSSTTLKVETDFQFGIYI